MGAACSLGGADVAVSQPVQVTGDDRGPSDILSAMTAANAIPVISSEPTIISAGDADVDPDLEKLKRMNRCDSCILQCGILVQKGNYEGAVDELKKALQHFPDSARAHYELGICQHKLGRLSEAVQSLTSALELHKELYMAYVNRARVYIDQERYMDAIADCKMALIIDCENPDSYTVKQLAEEKLECKEGRDMLGDIFNSPGVRQERKICIICMDDERGCRLHPCLHAALCVQCAEDLKERNFKCPICNSSIQEVEPGLFMDTYSYSDNTLQMELITAAAEARAGMSPLATPTLSAAGQVSNGSGVSPMGSFFGSPTSGAWTGTSLPALRPNAGAAISADNIPPFENGIDTGNRATLRLQQESSGEERSVSGQQPALLANRPNSASTSQSDPAETSILDGDLTIDLEGIPAVAPVTANPAPAVVPSRTLSAPYSQLTVEVN